VNLPRFALGHRAIVLAAALIAMLVGVATFLEMSRREDPEIVIRVCKVVTRWPGATAEDVENLVTDPLEEAISEIDEVAEITSESRVGLSIISVELSDAVADTDQSWDEVRAKVQNARGALPRGCYPPYVNSDFGDVYVVLLALYQVPLASGEPITHPYTARELEVLADRISDELETIESVGRVVVEGVQEEVIYVETASADWARIGLTSSELVNLLEARNIIAPGGSIETSEGSFAVHPTGAFQDVSGLGDVLVGRLEGRAPVRLRDLDALDLSRRYREPPERLLRFNSPTVEQAPCLALAVTMKDGYNVVELGSEVEERVEQLMATVVPPDVRITRVNDLPRQVQSAVHQFTSNLWQAILIVLLVSWLMMGTRPALIMAAAVPLCMLSATALMPLFGVELERASIASLIVALGMIVDNAIVVSDNSVRLLREGKPRDEAMARGAHDLAIPVLTSTLTTVGVFAPMILIPGNVGEYVRSLPIVVAATLLISFLVAMCVTPILGDFLLGRSGSERRVPGAVLLGWLGKPFAAVRKRRRDARASGPRYDRLAGWCLAHKAPTLGFAVLALLGSVSLIPAIGTQFFPPAYRDQVFIDVWLPEGAGIQQANETCRRVEEVILSAGLDPDSGEQRVVNTVSFVGYGGPRLMLVSHPEPQRANYAHVVVNTSDPQVSEPLAQSLAPLLRQLPGTRIEVRLAELGPPVDHPVEFRLSGPGAGVLREQAERMVTAFAETPGTLGAFSDWRNDSYQLEIQIDDDAANLAGVTNAHVADTLHSLLSGAYLTTYREGDHQVPVILRARRADREDLARLDGVSVNGLAGKVPLSSLAEVIPTWQPSVIARRDRIKTVTVGSQVQPGYLANDVAAAIRPKLEALLQGLPSDYRLAEAGEQEETTTSLRHLRTALTSGLLLIVLILVAQYNSLLKPFVILSTLPLALSGALLGLYVTGWPLGFMAGMGIISLFGIVINNAIVLIDFIQSQVREGMPLREATVTAGRIRMRPILLTALTTIGGLLPLGLFGGPLFAPLAWAMLFGLATSTLLTLFVIPTVFVLFAERFKMRMGS